MQKCRTYTTTRKTKKKMRCICIIIRFEYLGNKENNI